MLLEMFVLLELFVATGAAVAGPGCHFQFVNRRQADGTNRGNNGMFRHFQTATDQSISATADAGARTAFAAARCRRVLSVFESGHRERLEGRLVRLRLNSILTDSKSVSTLFW